MAIGSTAEWEYRAATGSNLNGGGYTGGGIDYSQQTSPELSLSDVVANGTTTLTSATGGWTANMIGNIGYESGTATHYEIKTFVSGNEITVDRNVTSGFGLTFNVGGALAMPTSALLNLMTGGDQIAHVKDDGAITFTADWTISVDGNITYKRPSRVIGYNTTRGDSPSGTDRPTLAMGTYKIYNRNKQYWHFANFDVTGTGFAMFNVGSFTTLKNIKTNNTNGSGGRCIYSVDPDANYIGCEVMNTTASTTATNSGLGGTGTNRVVYDCYFHDLATGIDANANSIIERTIIDTINYDGIILGAGSHNSIVRSCTIYNCTNYGIKLGSSTYARLIEDTLFDSNGVGLGSTSANAYQSALCRNNWNGNTTDISNLMYSPKCYTATSDVPGFENAAAGLFTPDSLTDFTLATGAIIQQGAVPKAAGGGDSEQVWGYV